MVIFLIMDGLIINGRASMEKLGDWVQRTREPLPGFPAFD